MTHEVKPHKIKQDTSKLNPKDIDDHPFISNVITYFLKS